MRQETVHEVRGLTEQSEIFVVSPTSIGTVDERPPDSSAEAQLVNE